MRSHDSLPEALQGRIFSVRTGRYYGVSDSRLRGSDLERPFRGVRVHGAVESLRDRCRSLSTAMEVHQVFSHQTAAELWGMPLPGTSPVLNVLSLGRRGPMRRPGVKGWERRDDRLVVCDLDGLRVTTPADTWCQMALSLSSQWLVAIGDFLISGKRTDQGRDDPLCTLEELEQAVIRHGARRGAAALASALPLLRSPVDSPPESWLRLALVDGGLPEPEVQLAVRTRAGLRHGDLGYRHARLLIEYQGDEHRTSRKRWLADLTRVQLLEDAGYRVLLVGADDLRDNARALVSRIRRILESD